MTNTIDPLGGMVEAVKRGFPQREIADAAFELRMDIDAGQRGDYPRDPGVLIAL